MTDWDSERIREIWDGLAEAWDRNRTVVSGFLRPVTEHLIDLLDPLPGETILEVGAGPGDTGFLIAERVAPSGRVISTDLAPKMLERARAAAERLDIRNIEFAVMEVTALDLDDASVDAVVGRLVYHLVPDPAGAFAEARRVLRRGGRLCYTVFAPDEKMRFELAIQHTMSKRELSFPPGITIDVDLSDLDAVRAVTASAGFAAVDVHEVPFEISFSDGDAVWRYVTEMYGRAAALINGLPGDEQQGFRADFLAELAPFHGPAGYAIPGACLNVLAR